MIKSMGKTKIIDVHTFIGTKGFSAYHVSSTSRTLLNSMNASGISQAVAITSSGRNEFVRKIVEKFSDKLLFAMWYLPDNSYFKYLRRHVKEIKMVKFHPSHAKMRFDNPVMLPMIKYCEDNNIPILVHCGRWLEMSSSTIPILVAENFKANILLAHMGGVTEDLVIKTANMLGEKRMGNVFLVTSGISVNSRVSEARIVQCPSKLIDYVASKVGYRKILFGTDYPFGKQTDMIESINNVRLSLSDREAIFHLNAEKILSLGV